MTRYVYKVRAFDMESMRYFDGQFKCSTPPNDHMEILEQISGQFRRNGQPRFIPLYVSRVHEKQI